MSRFSPRKFLSVLAVLAPALGYGAASSPGEAAETMKGPFVSAPAAPHLSKALRLLPKAGPAAAPVYIRPRHNPLAGKAVPLAPERTGAETDSALAQAEAGRGNRSTPAPLFTFEGQSNLCACSPPDTNGDVGPNDYVQIVNSTQIAVYDKAGNIRAGYPKAMNALWSSGDCSTANNGDPNVVYDSLANRWLLAQFDPVGNGVCIALSQTADPTGAYYLYNFITPEFPDYFKIGVWPDGYYMSANESTYTAYALDRAKMLSGLAASSIRFTGQTNFLMPADVDGKTAPAAGTPAPFYTFKDNNFHGGTDRLELFSFHADWVSPANSTFTLTNTFNISSFTYTVCGFFVLNCIPQGGTTTKVDPVSEWPMFRFPYRNFGTYQALAGNFTVESATVDAAAVRWFELRNTGSGWTLYQQGTVDSADGVSRWMGSIAFDQAGNLALGYSASSASMFPAIRYAVHRSGDAPGTMQPEQTLIAGGGSQTGSNRWGDYSDMTIDPSDDASFWYTTEYYPASASVAWHTRIGKFRILDTLTFLSNAARDGFILETSETSGAGGLINSTSNIRAGDFTLDRQLRDIVSFDTAALPDTAVITKSLLGLYQQGPVTGSNPFPSLGIIYGDIRRGGFNGNSSLEAVDFQAPASYAAAVGIRNTPSAGWYWGALKAAALPFVNKTGDTQVRLRFATDDNDNGVADYISFFGGDASQPLARPRLSVTYYVP